MITKQYNVLWADDEIDAFLPSSSKIRERFAINVIGTATNGTDLESLIQKYKGKIDAIIVDANFNKSSKELNKRKGERDLSGLQYALTLEYSMKQNGVNCPFLIYTARDQEILNDEFYNEELKPFYEDDRIFSKLSSDGMSEMFTRLVELVDEAQTPVFLLRTQYADELKIAELFPDAERILMEGLLLGHDAVENIQDLFNPIRGIVEQLVTKLQQLGYLPCVSLNCIPRLFLNEGKFEEGYALKKSFMHKTLAQSFAYFLSITQDGSHKKEDVRLKVFDYSLSRQNTNLYKSVLFIAMDLLLWFRDTLMVEPDPENILRTYIVEGFVMKYPIENNKSQHYVGKYQLQWKEGLKEGVKVGIFKASSSKQPYKDITEFVLRKDYDILTD